MQRKIKKSATRNGRPAKTPRRTPRASTSDILAAPPQPRVPAKWKAHWDRLVRWRDEFTRRKGQLTRDAQSEQQPVSLHIADAGTDAYDRDFALTMLSSEQNALYEIEQALDRIKNGSYAVCELTGKPIEAKRLKAIPWARFSAEAEKKLEKQGAVNRARLSPLESISKKTPRPKREEE